MGEPRIVFNSSALPHAGSTFLQSILAQDPRFYCSGTSGVATLLNGVRIQFADLPTSSAPGAALMLRGFRSFCRGALLGFYEGVTEQPVCVDKSRGWLLNYEWLSSFYPNPKVLCCVRDLRDVLSSLEKQWRLNQQIPGREERAPGLTMMSLQNRVLTWMNGPVVGAAANVLVDLAQRGLLNDVCIVRYEDLTADPVSTMRKVYAYLAEPAFDHDFDLVAECDPRDDGLRAGRPERGGSQTIERRIPDSVEILGRHLSAQIPHSFPLYYAKFYADAT